MTTTLRLFVRPFVSRRSAVVAVMVAGSALMLLPCGQASAGFFGRALNPQPLPPGLASPYHPGPTASQTRTPLNIHPTSRRVCVAWARVCVKAAPSPPTREGPCEQYEYVCRKYV